MGRKVVYCPHVGGFELSPKAIKRYFELIRPEVTLYFYKSNYDEDWVEWFHKIDPEDSDYSSPYVFLVDLGNLVKIKNIEDKIYRDHCIFLYDFYKTLKRHDPNLIKVVEELGIEASSDGELVIEDIGESKYHLYVSDETEAEWIITELPEGFWI